MITLKTWRISESGVRLASLSGAVDQEKELAIRSVGRERQQMIPAEAREVRMLNLNNVKSTYQQNWYKKNKERIAKKRKNLYAENPEYREQRIEASRRYRTGERTPPIPPDAPISYAEAAKRVGLGYSTLVQWRGRKFFPEPKHHNRGLWFTEKQVELLKLLKEFFRKYKMRPRKITQPILAELRASIFANWK